MHSKHALDQRATPQEHEGAVTRLRTSTRAGLVMLAVTLGLFGYAGPASAQVEQSITTGFGSLVQLIVGVLATALFGITVAALGIKMGVRWLKKGASS